MSQPTLFWFRRDLRLADNPALHAAVAASNGTVAPVFVVDETFATRSGPNRLTFLRESLESLRRDLGGELTVWSGEPADVLARLAGEIGARAVYATQDFGPSGRQRDDAVAQALATRGLTLHLIDSPYVVRPGTVTTKTGTPAKVFGAFQRGWVLEPRPLPEPAPRATWVSRGPDELARLSALSPTPPAYFPAYPPIAAVLPEAGEDAAHRVLESFLDRVAHYDEERNIPALDATSRLSPYLRWGAIHPRQVLAATSGPSRGSGVFQSEIVWREFYADVLFHHPQSVREELQPLMKHLRVDRDDRAVERFHAWALGLTGYPLVDAGMRQLLAEGWMHNRVRMVTASFLVKHLHLDWRWGARWFMWHLVDGDVASNQHGWQWVAGTGTDAAPYHRVFNPTLQAERFDPTGAYVRRWIPELAEVAAPDCLQPGAGGGLLGANYVAPIVDAARERDEALARFAEVRALRAASE